MAASMWKNMRNFVSRKNLYRLVFDPQLAIFSMFVLLIAELVVNILVIKKIKCKYCWLLLWIIQYSPPVTAVPAIHFVTCCFVSWNSFCMSFKDKKTGIKFMVLPLEPTQSNMSSTNNTNLHKDTFKEFNRPNAI